MPFSSESGAASTAPFSRFGVAIEIAGGMVVVIGAVMRARFVSPRGSPLRAMTRVTSVCNRKLLTTLDPDKTAGVANKSRVRFGHMGYGLYWRHLYRRRG
jgi:hypothetical protein